jgi:tetratricopeptide (TPR) repeat protein
MSITWQMSRFFASTLFALLLVFDNVSYSQNREKQIDSILDSNTQTVALNQVSKTYNASKIMGYDKGMVEALILFAKSSYAAGKYGNSFKYITQAENASAKITDPVILCNIKTFKGLCYGRLGFYKEADQTLNSAIPLAKTIANKDDMHYYLLSLYTDLAINCGYLGNSNAKALWNKKAFAESTQLQTSSKYAWCAGLALSNRGELFTQRKQYDSAKYYLDKGRLLIKKVSDLYKHKKNYAQFVNYFELGNLYYQVGKLDRAAIYYKESANAASLIHEAVGLKKAYDGLAKTYTSLNDLKQALRYSQISVKLADSLALADKASIKDPLNYIVTNKDRQIINERRKYEWIGLIVFIGSILIILVITYYRYRYKQEIKLTNIKLDALVKEAKLNGDKPSPAKVEELKNIVQLAVTNNPSLLIKFNEFDTKFTSRLLAINPNLIATEIEFCVMLRLNFETKEIARYTKTSVRSVEGKKYRIRKKLNINSEKDINVWMTHL